MTEEWPFDGKDYRDQESTEAPREGELAQSIGDFPLSDEDADAAVELLLESVGKAEQALWSDHELPSEADEEGGGELSAADHRFSPRPLKRQKDARPVVVDPEFDDLLEQAMQDLGEMMERDEAALEGLPSFFKGNILVEMVWRKYDPETKRRMVEFWGSENVESSDEGGLVARLAEVQKDFERNAEQDAREIPNEYTYNRYTRLVWETFPVNLRARIAAILRVLTRKDEK